MAEKRSVTIVSPLYSPGVEYATVRSPQAGTPPDPLGILDPTGAQVPFLTAGGGDDVNDWTEEFPDGGR
jgi:hypothetical protein